MKKGMKKKDALSDERFAHIRSDPKFSGISTAERKVVIEKRFAAALTDAKFSDSARVDKRGRLLKKKKNDLADLYTVESGEKEKKKVKKEKTKKKEEIVDEESEIDEEEETDENESDDSESDDEDRVIKVDLARGEGNVSSSDDSDSDDSEWELPTDLQVDMDVAQLDSNVERVEWASRRLAACNLDWDLVKAEDLYILVNSFKPSGGRVQNVSIYLSDFGKERLEEEDKLGPRLILTKPIEEYNDDETLDPETKLAVRKYQIDKLKYYYAVIECDTDTTATSIYENCDGFQFEDSGLKMDLRFVPDDMEFEEERLKERMSEDDVNTEKYKSKEKMKSAVTNSSGKLQWDEGDGYRTKILQDAFDDNNADGRGLIAQSDSEDEDTLKSRRNALLSLLDDKPKEDDLKISWGEKGEESDSDDSDIEKALARRNADGSSDEDEEPEVNKAKKAPTKSKKKNGYEAYLEKKKEKRKERKQQMRDVRQSDKSITQGNEAKKKKTSRAELKESDYGTASAVLADDRFKALLTDSAFAIEQTDKLAKGSKLVELQAHAKKSVKKEIKKDVSLVDSLKTKADKWNSKKKK